MKKNLLRSLLAIALASAATVRGQDVKSLSTIAFGSCCHQSRSQAFWDPIIRTKPDLFIFCGDNIYADTHDMKLQRHKYAQLSSQPGFRNLKATCPVLATWDDHDFGLNDCGADFPEKVASQVNFLDFWNVPRNAPRRQHEGVYDAKIFGPAGQRVQVILLDTRYFRSPLRQIVTRRPGEGRYTANRDTNATLLGDAQWKWLDEQLRKPADVRLLISSIQAVAQDHNWEKWMNFPQERARLFRLIHSTGARGLIILSGDRHVAELGKMRSALVGYPLYDLTSSGLNMTYAELKYEPNRHRVGRTIVKENNFGTVSVDWKQRDPLVTLEIRTVSGAVPIRQEIRLSELQPPP